MSAINKAFKSVSPGSGGNNGAKPGTGATKKNHKGAVSKLSMTDVIDEKNKIKDGETDVSAEVANTDEEKNTGTTTQQTNTDQAAKKATKTPKEKLNSYLEEMGAKIDEHREQMASRSMEAQNAAAMAEQNKQAQEMQKLAALQQAKQKTPTPPKASSPSSRKKSSNSATSALKKMAEKQKQSQEQVNKLAKALKEQKESSSSKEVASKLKEAQKIIDAQKAKETNSGDKTKSPQEKVNFNFETVMKLQDSAKEAMKEGINPSEAEKILLGLNKVADATHDPNITNTRNEFKAYMERGSTVASRSAGTNETENWNTDFEVFDNSFSLNSLKEDSSNNDLKVASKDTTEETTDSVEEEEQQQVEEDIILASLDDPE